MATNNIKIFDENKSNMLSNEAYGVNSQRLNGVQQGIASSQLQNKTLYQVSLVAYAIGQMMQANGFDANDELAVSAFCDNMSKSIMQKTLDLVSADDVTSFEDTKKYINPATWKAAFDFMKADTALIQAGTDDTHYVTPKGVSVWENKFGGKIRLPDNILGEYFEKYIEYVSTLVFYNEYDNLTTTDIKSVLTPNGKYLIELVLYAGNAQGKFIRSTIYQIDIETRKIIKFINLPSSVTNSVTGQIFYADDTHVICSDSDYTIRIYNFSGSNIIEEFSNTYENVSTSRIIRKPTTDDFLLFVTEQGGVVTARKYDKSTKSITNSVIVDGSSSMMYEAGFSFDSSGNAIIVSAYYSSSTQKTHIVKYDGLTATQLISLDSSYTRSPERMCVISDVVCFCPYGVAQLVFYNLKTGSVTEKDIYAAGINFVFDERYVYDVPVDSNSNVSKATSCHKYSLSGDKIVSENIDTQIYSALNIKLNTEESLGCLVNTGFVVFGVNKIDIANKVSIGGVLYPNEIIK